MRQPAFEKEQAELFPAYGVRQDVAEAMTAHPRPKTSYQWIAVAAVVVIGVLVVVALMSTRTHSAAVPAKPRATPVADYGPPPAGVSLVYVQDPHNPAWMIGFDWTGKPRGTVKLAQPIDQNASLVQAPDGSGFALEPGKVGNQQFFDRLGNVIPSQSAPQTHDFQMWADDSRHVCTLGYSTGQWLVGLRTPAAATSQHVVALDSSNLGSGIIAITFASCSARNDVAALVYNYFGRSSEIWIVRLSDGKILMHQTHPADTLSDIAVSQDGSLYAENSATSDGQIAPAAPSTIIRRVSDGSVVSTLAASMAVLAFNTDDSLALVATSPWVSGSATQLALVDAHTGAVTWRYSGGEEAASFFAQPGGRDFAVVLQQAPSDTSLHPSVNIVIVHADGTTAAIPGYFVRI